MRHAEKEKKKRGWERGSDRVHYFDQDVDILTHTTVISYKEAMKLHGMCSSLYFDLRVDGNTLCI